MVLFRIIRFVKLFEFIAKFKTFYLFIALISTITLNFSLSVTREGELGTNYTAICKDKSSTAFSTEALISKTAANFVISKIR